MIFSEEESQANEFWQRRVHLVVYSEKKKKLANLENELCDVQENAEVPDVIPDSKLKIRREIEDRIRAMDGLTFDLTDEQIDVIQNMIPMPIEIIDVEREEPDDIDDLAFIGAVGQAGKYIILLVRSLISALKIICQFNHSRTTRRPHRTKFAVAWSSHWGSANSRW